ncbi:MAG: hypothetical protein SGARI_005158, partial [Bacillariaceae sp.]
MSRVFHPVDSEYMADAPLNARGVITVGDMVVDEQDYYNVLPVIQMFYDYYQKASKDEDVIQGIAEDDENDDDWTPPTFNEIFEMFVKTQNCDSSTTTSNRITSLNVDSGGGQPGEVCDYMDWKVTFLPASISLLEHLEYLRFYYADNVRFLPKNISLLQNLRELEIVYIGLRELPEDLVDLVNLKKLTLRHNIKLRQFPTKFPPNLEELNMSFGIAFAMTRAIPESVCALTQLKRLSINFNSLSGIPESFRNLRNLEAFIDTAMSYRHNTIRYRVPAFVLELPRLKEIKTDATNLRQFQSPETYKGSLTLQGMVWPQYDPNDPETTFSLCEWSKVTRLHLDRCPDGAFAHGHFLSGTFPSLTEIRSVCVESYSIAEDAAKPGLEMEQLLNPKALEK